MKIIIFFTVAIAIFALLPISKYVRMFYRFRRTKPELQEKIKNSDKIVTVFFQGHGAARSQGAKYFGNYGICTELGDHRPYTHRCSFIRHAPQLLYNAYRYNELTDVEYGFSFNPIKLIFILGNMFKSFFVGLPVNHFYYPVIEKDNIAGFEDIEQLTKAIKSCIKEYPDKDIVVFGCSRGASTVYSTIASLDKNLTKAIKLVIVEAPFDTVPNAINARVGSFLSPIIESILTQYTSYHYRQPSPLDYTEYFPLDIPVAFVMAKNDKIVPMSLTENLITGLEKRGHTKIHKLVLNNSCHVDMPLGDTQDQIEYKRFVDTLYNKYIY